MQLLTVPGSEAVMSMGGSVGATRRLKPFPPWIVRTTADGLAGRTRLPGRLRAAPAIRNDQGWFARIEWTSAPSETVEEKKLMTLSPVIVSSPM
jgi:hypothetical protein